MFDLLAPHFLLAAKRFLDLRSKKRTAIPAAHESGPTRFAAIRARLHVVRDGTVCWEDARFDLLQLRSGTLINDVSTGMTLSGVIEKIRSTVRTRDNLHFHGK